MKKIIVIGAGGHAISVAESVFSSGFEIECFVDINSKQKSIFNCPIVKEVPYRKNIDIVIAIADNFKRNSIVNDLKKKYSKINFPNIFHKFASISNYAGFGEGNIVMQNAVVGSKSKIGSFCIVNSSSNVDHNNTLDDFSSLAPGAVLGGNVKIGKRTAVCIGATIKNNIQISSDVVIGANSYVNKNFKSNLVVYGTPAKEIRNRNKYDKYL
ncbi:MAG: transferase [Pelagibacterales bacterium]|nr:transferase [Pelagibacterales bacterium]|tara:strand:- start:10132 stop:10767 length:636 start_codon:yes stop_codon:yes gene_type:complete